MLVNVEMYARSISPEKALLSQVILVAITDGCYAPPKGSRKIADYVSDGNTQMHPHPYTAMRFLFDRREAGLEAYAAWLDFDEDQFRSKLLKLMANDGPNDMSGYSSMQRRAFRINYKNYIKLADIDPNEIPVGWEED